MTTLAAAALALTYWFRAPAGRAVRRIHRRNPRRGALSTVFLGTAVPAALAAARLRVPPVAVALLTVGAASLAVHRRRQLRSRARRARDEHAVALCFVLAAELRAGRTPAEALASAARQPGPLAGVLNAAARAVRRGAPVDEELRAAAQSTACARLLTVAAVWSAAGAGARVAEVLDRVGAAYAHADANAADLDALAAGPRATALVLCGLPAVAAGLGAALGGGTFRVLMHTVVGGFLVTTAGLLDLAGLLWVRRITATALAAPTPRTT